MTTTSRHLGLGRLAYRFYHAPLGRIRRSLAAGGPIEEWRTARGHREMAEAARQLPPPARQPTAADPGSEVHVLTGSRFWDQTVFCLWSLAQKAGRPFRPVIYDDGTLTDPWRAPLARLFPSARFVDRGETAGRLDQFLPASRFPVLRERWRNYPNIRKLTDVHAGGAGWKLVLDSDLLFFRRPEFLLEWLDSPSRPLHGVDAETSYGYSPRLLEELAGRKLPERLNVGLCGLRSEALDWDRLEGWSRELIGREGTHYYLEQALVAILLAGEPCAVAPEFDYLTLPQPPEATECRAVMHHYVAGSKRWYFRENWRRALAG